MRYWLKPSPLRIGLATLLSLSLAGWLGGKEARPFIVFALVTAGVLYVWMLGLRWAWRGLGRPCASHLQGKVHRYRRLLSLVGLLMGMGLYLWVALWTLRPNLLPQRTYYDCVANRQVTERLVDPELLKVERWEILGQEREVLFVHPTSSGSTALVYPVKVKPRTTLRAHLAVAPEAWTKEGDGVTFSIYVEDEAGIHLIYGRYVDPKHHERDRRWLPLRVDLSPYQGKLVRVIFAVGSGPAGDGRYDWAGWGEPRFERPIWP